MTFPEPVTVSELRADLRRILATAHYFGPRYMILRNGHAVVAEGDEAEGLPAVGRRAGARRWRLIGHEEGSFTSAVIRSCLPR